MDLNLVVLCGTVAAPVEHRRSDDISTLARLLLAVRSDTPSRRLDVVPVLMWDPPDDVVDGSVTTGTRLWVTGRVRRRSPQASNPGSGGSIEIVALHASVREPGLEIADG